MSEIPRASYKQLVKAIKNQCIECFGGSQYEVKFCTSHKCSLYPYRLGAKMAGIKGNAEHFKKHLETSAGGDREGKILNDLHSGNGPAPGGEI